ncbi:unnamed protein product [Haemonchus placei]|uniref:Uncharacterized protein n=1 Tax=Haemonchus placei TaxID=6290 RepID=A0A0N4VSG4_HAEPC|nr:unnamed protein product [Haemonchus placei]
MASTVRTVEGASGGDIENNVNGSQKRDPYVEKCGEVSYRLSTVEVLAATDGVADSDVDFELERLGWVGGSDFGTLPFLHFMLPPADWLLIAPAPRWSWP